jgi:hypothetical protein
MVLLNQCLLDLKPVSDISAGKAMPPAFAPDAAPDAFRPDELSRQLERSRKLNAEGLEVR